MSAEKKVVKKKVLVVDDEEEIRFLLETKFFKLGYNVDVAATGLQALTKVKSNPQGYSLVVCDLKMPRMDGVQFFNEMNKITPNTQFLMITGYPEKEKLVAAMKSGIVHIMLKPVKHSEIVEKVEELIGSPTEEVSE